MYHKICFFFILQHVQIGNYVHFYTSTFLFIVTGFNISKWIDLSSKIYQVNYVSVTVLPISL